MGNGVMASRPPATAPIFDSTEPYVLRSIAMMPVIGARTRI